VAKKDDISSAFARRDTNFSVNLSEKRRVSISEFKNVLLYNIREYYEKDGKELPGRKGVSLTKEQWNSLMGSVAAIETAVDELQAE